MRLPFTLASHVSSKKLPLLLLALGILLTIYRRTGSLAQPLVGQGDTEHLEWMPFLFTKIVRLLPWPHLTLTHDWTLFPHGGTTTYLPFSWESNYAVGALWWAFGPGPWSYVYFLATQALLFGGCLWLLSRVHGRSLSAWVAFMLVFLNAYSQNKFPRHANMAFCHWTTLTLVYHYVLLTALQRRAQVVSTLVVVLPLIAAGMLGQDPGYLLPITATSWVVFITATLVSRGSREALKARFSWRWLRDAAAGQARLGIAVAALTLLMTFLYLPLNLQVGLDALANRPDGQQGLWVNPARWLIPAFPYLINPDWSALIEWFPRLGDIELAGCPGWNTLVPALLGIALGSRRSPAFLYLAVMVLLIVTYHPDLFPTLRLLPWHAMSRASFRYTLALGPLLVLLSIPFWEKLRAQRSTLVAAVAALVLVETVAQAVAFRVTLRALSAEERAYYEVIRRSPGTALLEWPFCVTAWNSPEGEGPCLRRGLHYATYNAQRFHEKKVASLDIGRASAREREQWKRIPTLGLMERLAEGYCPGDAGWKSLLEELHWHDYAGIEIYPGLLPPDCAAELSRRLGQPTARLRAGQMAERAFFRREAVSP